jgi:NAD(P)-dependent dehydrogenase (short-subunit alcohol dehydrogenase family)
MTDPRTWFITGTSRGFGREWAEAALARGERVAGTARDLASVQPLVDAYPDTFLALQLDVADHDADFAAVRTAAEHFGRLDVIVNNAGYGQFGMIEELSEQEVRAQLETNTFGALWITQAALPYLREQGSGHILQVSSIGGISAFPNIGIYNASKWALEGFSQALAQEVAEFGIHVTIIEPGGFTTDWGGASAKHAAPIAAYDAGRERRAQARRGMGGYDPKDTSAAILAVVDSDEPPLRLFLGAHPLDMAKADYAGRIAEWEKWDAVSVAAGGSRD